MNVNAASGPSARTLRRRALRKKSASFLRQALFVVDLQFKGIRNAITELKLNRADVEVHQWPRSGTCFLHTSGLATSTPAQGYVDDDSMQPQQKGSPSGSAAGELHSPSGFAAGDLHSPSGLAAGDLSSPSGLAAGDRQVKIMNDDEIVAAYLRGRGIDTSSPSWQIMFNSKVVRTMAISFREHV